jgi:uncharacterized protein DUF899
MCPFCLATLGLVVAGTVSTGGLGLTGAKQRRNKMTTSKERDKEHGKRHLAVNTPPIVSQQEWEAARQQLLVKEKALTRSRDALAAERRRMPWIGGGKEVRVRRAQG